MIKIKDYYQLSKPGIIYGNLLTAAAGYLFASHWHNDYRQLLAMLIGLGLIIGSSCAINNVIDRGLDVKMERTKNRAVAIGKISVKSALIYAAIIGLVGIILLGALVNILALSLALLGAVIYIIFYGIAKRRSVYGTLIGSLSGAVPPIVGYAADTRYLDLGSIILLLILVCWQLAHFYGIALYRKKEYQAAGLPVWPIVKGDWNAQLQAIGSIGIFSLLAISLFILGYSGYIYLIVMLIASLAWLWYSVVLTSKLNASAWGKKIFISSLAIMLIFCLSIALGPILP